MKQLSIILLFLIVYSFSLFSCIGVQPTTVVQEGINISPLQPQVVATSKPTSTIDPTCKSIGYEAWDNEITGESGTGNAVCLDIPTSTPRNINKLSPEEQTVVATALAFLGDKAPYLKVESVGDRSVPGYFVDFQQVYQGIPVEDGRLSVIVEPDQLPWIVQDRYYKGVTIPSITPILTLEEAVDMAVNTLGITDSYKISTNFRDLQIIKVPTKSQTKKGTKTPIEDKPQKYVLAWFTILSLRCPEGTWNLWIDANTGGVLRLGLGDRWDFGPPPTPNCPIPKFVPPTAALAP